MAKKIQQLIIHINAGETKAVNVSGDMLHVFETTANFVLKIDGQNDMVVRKGSRLSDLKRFERLEIFSSVANDLIINYGFAKYDELSASIEIDDTAQIEVLPVQGDSAPTLSDVTIAPLTAVTVVAGKANRKSLLIKNLEQNLGPLRVQLGGTASATNGHELGLGESVATDDPFSVSVYNTDPTNSADISLLEVLFT